MIWLSGFFIGMLIMAILCGRVVFKVNVSKKLRESKIKLVKVKIGGEKRDYVSEPKSLGEAIETLLVIVFHPLTQYKRYTLIDEKRTKRFIIFLFLIGILCCILALVSIVNVFIQ